MTSNDALEVTSIASIPQALRLARRMSDLAAASMPVHLDLRPLDRAGSPQHVRISAASASVVTNVLLGRCSRVPVHVDLPDNNGIVLQLARGGLLFALAHHEQCTIGARPPGLEEDVARWKEDWRPADPAQATFFDPGGLDAPATIGTRFLAFINPDRSPLATANAERASTIAPWLNELARGVLPDLTAREHLLADVNMAVTELCENIVDHAKLIDRDSCYAMIFATKGPRADSSNRITIVAHDTGVGFPTAMGTLSDEADFLARVASPFNATMPRYDRDRAKGLSRVVAMIRRRGGAALFAATSAEQHRDDTIIVRGPKKGTFVPEAHDRAPLKGSIVQVSFRISLPQQMRSDVRHAQREALRLRPQQLELLQRGQ